MRLLNLKITDYRNLEDVSLECGRELTVICGNNAQGKTNLLEAIWLLTGGKSFRGGKDAELIRRGQPFAVIAAEIQSEAEGAAEPDSIRLTVGAPDSQRAGRYASVNGGRPMRASSMAGRFPAVVFDPGHLSLVKGAPEGRRRFLDAALCQFYPGYLDTYRRYVRALKQKNALLRKSPEHAAAVSMAEKRYMLEALNAELAAQGEKIQRRRLEYLDILEPVAYSNYAELSHETEIFSVKYERQFEAGGLAERLKKAEDEEIRAGQSLYGVHREDLAIYIDDMPAKLYASQGQQRSAVLSLKMAEAAAAAQITGEHPVLLLDDVLSELDDSRRQYLLTRMEEKQTFVTGCDDSAFLKTDGEVYIMESGKLRKS